MSPAVIVDRSAKHVIVSVSGITLKRFARDGSPDNAFTPVSGPLVTPVIALDDSVYTAASATISHYSAAGAADTNYGTAGKSVTITPSPITSSLNLGPAPANAVIAFGNNMVLTETRATKLDANGAFDAGFAFTPWSHPNAGETIAGPIHVLPGGSFLAAVGAKTIGVGLVRFTATGALDTTFAGGAGYVDAPMATTSAIMTAAGLRVTGDYAFVLGTGNTADKHGLARFTLNGTLDAGFGEAASPGVLSTPSRPPGTGAAFDIDPSGRPVVASVTTVGGTRMLSLARYTAAGKPDVAFAPTGFVTMPFGTVAPRAVVAVDAERALVIGVKDGNGFIARFWM